ncbi:hypothetical protein ACHAXA_008806 [Cyclostephanos tholiformis]|uniref:Disease resistance R13L4/SHOC-2-like LRR domain-containing protein n=1 Tax=Cyclostephanos tholiformis TaxID=382380 RepID=A0ABD3RUC1_9STRA
MSTSTNNDIIDNNLDDDDGPSSVVIPPPASAFAIVDIENDDDDDDDDAIARLNGDPNDGATIFDDGLSVVVDDDDDRGGGGSNHRTTMTSSDAMRLKRDANLYRTTSTCALLSTLMISAVVASFSFYSRWDGSSTFGMRQSATTGDHGNDDDDDYGPAVSNGLDVSANEARLRRALDYLVATDASSPSTLQHPAGTTASSITQAGLEGGSGGTMAFMMDGTISPQYRAAVWLAQYDGLRLDVPWGDDDDGSGGGSGSSGVEYAFLQRYALAVLFLSLGGLSSPWVHGLNFMREWHECGWSDNFWIEGSMETATFGIQCDGDPDYEYDGGGDGAVEYTMEDDRIVTGVFLPPFNNLVGTLPPELRHLRYLKVLDVGQNLGAGGGEIPFEYGTLKNLQVLSLVNFGLYGTIPRSLSYNKKLFYLDLSLNMLTANTTIGDLDFLADMSALERLYLEYNSGITGTLPDIVSDLTSLVAFSVSKTGLHGTLPPSLSRLTNLNALYLDDCNFTGSLDVVMEMTNLTHVYLEDNWFTGIIDDDFFANTMDLEHLDVSNCSLRGYIPGHLFNMSKLEVLDLSDNEIGGILPGGAMNASDWGALKFLSLHTNNITGSIPSSIGNLRGLITLDLSQNRFTGSMPSEIGNLPDLDVLFLGENNYTKDMFPDWIEKLTSLSELMLKGSSLTGPIPPFLGDLTRMRFLDLGVNELTGTIPQELNNLGDLVVLILKSNMLVGELGLGELANLETLLIDDNRLTGDTSAICKHDIKFFISDCSKNSMNVSEIVCDCCTLCCRDENVTCNDADWLASTEGMWEFGYDRVFWLFGNDGIRR